MIEDVTGRRISVEHVIAAPPEKIFDVLADPAQHAVIDGSGTVKATRGGAPNAPVTGNRSGS